MTFDEAWAAHLKRQNIIPPNQQTFRHGWNAAIEAAARVVAGHVPHDDRDGVIDRAERGVRRLEVEVQT